MSISSRWPAARNCHVVLSDLEQTLLRNRYAATRSPGLQTLPYEPVSSTEVPGQQVPNVANRSAGPDGSLKRRRTDSNPQPSHSLQLQPSDLWLPPNADQSDLRTQVNQPCMHTGDPTAPQGGILLQSGQSSWLPPRHQPGQPQQPMSAGSQPTPIATSESSRDFDTAGFQTSRLRAEDTPWTSVLAAGNWDGGMPDILGGATWESLFHIFNQGNVSWDGDCP